MYCVSHSITLEPLLSVAICHRGDRSKYLSAKCSYLLRVQCNVGACVCSLILYVGCRTFFLVCVHVSILVANGSSGQFLIIVISVFELFHNIDCEALSTRNITLSIFSTNRNSELEYRKLHYLAIMFIKIKRYTHLNLILHLLVRGLKCKCEI